MSRFHILSIALLTVCICLSSAARAQQSFEPGEAFVTRFSGTASKDGRAVIDKDGAVGGIVDLRDPGAAPQGAQLPDAALRAIVTAGQVGQVFGIALDDASPPNVYLTATSAFGLHRNAGNSDWMDGMWGPGGGPGTVWKLNAQKGYKPEVFARIRLDGRENTGAALGNIAYDRWNKQLYVSDLETGMIHRLRASDGKDLGHYDHGAEGRTSFLDAPSGESRSLPAVAFDKSSSASITDCPSGDFARTPSCWGFSDFRRRVWGVAVRRDPAGEVRVYYSVWSSQGFGNPDYATAGDDQVNAIWSVGIGDEGAFDLTSVRREFFLPDFFRTPEAIARAGRSHPVSDIAFPTLGEAPIMVLAERGGVRNLGLTAENAFATPNEARVLRYQQNEAGVWEAIGRYDVGFYDRQNEGPPYVRAGASGGAAFGLGYTGDWKADPALPDAFIWMTGDGLCSRAAPCLDPKKGAKSDDTHVDGLSGRAEGAYEELVPIAAFQPYPAPGPATPADGPDRSFIIDLDAESARNDATRMGDVAIYEPGAKKPDLQISKVAQNERCEPGSECAFNIEIENVSDVFYAGPLVIQDTPDGGAALAGDTPDDWSCEAFVSPASGIYDCRHDEVTLEPGDKISLELTFTVPDTWDRNVFRNCAEITTPGFGEDEHAYNNKSCDYVPAVEPGVPNYGPDLMVEKFPLDWSCDWIGVCRFIVRVTNVGSDDYTGPLHIHDSGMTPGATLAHWEVAPWHCGPLGAGTFDCTHPSVTLTPGDFREVIIWLQAPPIGAGFTYVHNCARLDWDGADADFDPGNEFACADTYRYPPGHPEARARLSVTKVSGAICNLGGVSWECWNQVRITNTGGAPYLDPLVVSDTNTIVVGAADATLNYVGPTPPWSCAPGIGATGVQTCTRPPVPGGLQPGQTDTVDLVTHWPAGIDPNMARNCASVTHDNNGDGVAETIQSCAYSQLCWLGAGGNCANDLAVFKGTDLNPCWPGFPCQFDVTVTNVGPNPHPAGLVITDVPNPDAGSFTKTWESSPITCVPAGTNQVCTITNAIPAGSGLSFTFTFDVPVDYPWTSLKNCASVAASPINIYAINDEACVEAYIPGPDLEPWSGTECKRGESCELDARIDNSGKRPFKGATGVKGRLSPEVQITSISSETSGLNCAVTGAGSYECKASNLSLKPGGSAKFRLTIAIPADFPHSTIDHIKDMEWPDRKVKDRNPRNDHHVSTITIVGPEEAVEEPEQEPEEPEVLPPPPPGGPTCARGWTEVSARRAKQLRTKGWTIDEVRKGGQSILCAKPPPECPGGQVWDARRKVCACPGNLEWDAKRRQCVKPEPPPSCAQGWSQVDPAKAKLLSAQGWQFTEVGSGRRSILCGRPPQCRGGQVWDAKRRSCVCPGNLQWDPKRNACVRPEPPLTCAPGWNEVDQRKAKALRAQGWEIRQIGTGDRSILCAKEPTITCSGGRVQNGQCICPRGTERKQVGKTAFRCEKAPPPAQCEKGWVQVSRSKAKELVKQGWEIKQIQDILCARRRQKSELPQTTTPKSSTPKADSKGPVIKINPQLLKKLPGLQ